MTELGSISFDPQFCLFGSGSMLPTIPMSVISYKVGLGRNIQYPIKLLFFTINMPSIKHRNDSNNTLVNKFRLESLQCQGLAENIASGSEGVRIP